MYVGECCKLEINVWCVCVCVCVCVCMCVCMCRNANALIFELNDMKSGSGEATHLVPPSVFAKLGNSSFCEVVIVLVLVLPLLHDGPNIDF